MALRLAACSYGFPQNPPMVLLDRNAVLVGPFSKVTNQLVLQISDKQLSHVGILRWQQA